MEGMKVWIARSIAGLVLIAAAGVSISLHRGQKASVPATGKTLFDRGRREHPRPKVGQPGDETLDALVRETQFAQARTAPGLVLPGAYGAAFTALSGLPTTGGAWTEVTNRPYDSDDPRYRDPAGSRCIRVSFPENSASGMRCTKAAPCR